MAFWEINMKNIYGNTRLFSTWKTKKQQFCVPEVPLANSCMQYFLRHPRYAVCEEEQPNADKFKEAIKGLNLWYVNHMNRMPSKPKYKKCYENKMDSMSKQLFGPKMDLENYLNSLKSRQKELHNFGKVSKAWNEYFEKTIPGWLKRQEAQKLTSIVKNPKNKKTNDLSLNKNVRDYLLNSEMVKKEQTGNINNEILFNRVYGKYLFYPKQNQNDEVNKINGKLNKNSTNKNKLENMKRIDNEIIAKEKESELRNSNGSRNSKLNYEDGEKLNRRKSGSEVPKGSMKSDSERNSLLKKGRRLRNGRLRSSGNIDLERNSIRKKSRQPTKRGLGAFGKSVIERYLMLKNGRNEGLGAAENGVLEKNLLLEKNKNASFGTSAKDDTERNLLIQKPGLATDANLAASARSTLERNSLLEKATNDGLEASANSEMERNLLVQNGNFLTSLLEKGTNLGNCVKTNMEKILLTKNENLKASTYGNTKKNKLREKGGHIKDENYAASPYADMEKNSEFKNDKRCTVGFYEKDKMEEISSQDLNKKLLYKLKALRRQLDLLKYPEAHPLGIYRQVYLSRRLKQGVMSSTISSNPKKVSNVGIQSFSIKPIVKIAEEPRPLLKKRSNSRKTDFWTRFIEKVNAICIPDDHFKHPLQTDQKNYSPDDTLKLSSTSEI